MAVVSTDTFSVEFPALYQETKSTWESIRGDYSLDDDIVSSVIIALNKVSHYDKFDGADFVDRFHNSCLEKRGAVEVLEDKTLPVAGQTAHIRTTYSAYSGYYFYFAVVKINDQFCYEFTGDCNIEDRNTYEEIFTNILQSLQYFGNQQDAFEKQTVALHELLQKYKSEPVHTNAEKELPEIKPFEIPANGRPYWIVDNISFEFLPESSCYISDASRTLDINMEGRMVDYREKDFEHIVNDYDNGQVHLWFSMKGIHNAGIPAGTFNLEKDREKKFACSLSKGGFHYSLELTGTLTLTNGWIGFEGYFQDIMQTHVYPVKIAQKIPVEDLQWMHYRFTSMAEVTSAMPENVHHLQLSDPYPDALHEAIRPLTQLRTFGISFSNNENPATALREIPREIKKFKHLTELSLTGISGVSFFPAWLGALKALKRLTLTNSQSEGVHPEIFQYAQLEYCNLSRNKLVTISPVLPDSLQWLWLEGNQLTSLPASLLKLPKLKYLNIKGNPFESLPDGLDKIPDLDLEIEKKQQLLDYTYKGANGKGVIVYDNSLFLAKNDATLLKVLDQAISEAGFGIFRQGLTALAHKAVALQTTEQDTYDSIGNTRFGGLPDLPTGTPYPSFKTFHGDTAGLQFIAQLNCAELAPYQDYLPRTGILYFFITDQQTLKPTVLYYDGKNADLVSARTLHINETFIYDDNGIYKPFRAEAGKYASVPGFYQDEHLYSHVAPELAALEKNDYDEIDKFRSHLGAGTKPVHSINSFVFKQHGSPELEAANKLKGKVAEWMVLLRVSSDQNTQFSFWDAGEIYFVIHKSDLAKRDFSNVYCGLESS
jgi:uncharacterized protein YwqG